MGIGTKARKYSMNNTKIHCKNGITLISLVITVIIMLILAGVTISIIINGGLFSQAQNAASGAQIAQADETVALIVNAAKMDSIINAEKSFDKIIGDAVSGTTFDNGKIAFNQDDTMATITDSATGRVYEISLPDYNWRLKTDTEEYDFSYTGEAQIFTAQNSGYYILEAWGASGGNSSASGGRGAYAKGTIFLTKGQEIYVYVGQTGIYGGPEGFNGGGACNVSWGYTGGGATDFRLIDGNWKDDLSLNSRILVAGAGGGRARDYSGVAYARTCRSA